MELIKLTNNWWQVVVDEKTILECPNIETAADVLIEFKVADKAIDEALCDIHALGHNRAIFGVNGTFIFSESKRL